MNRAQNTISQVFLNHYLWQAKMRKNPKAYQLYDQQRHLRFTAQHHSMFLNLMSLLTTEEHKAVSGWSIGSNADTWNAQLLGGQTTAPEVQLIRTAMTSVAAAQDLTVYAGISESFLGAYGLQHAGFSATSLRPEVALKFADPNAQFQNVWAWMPEHHSRVVIYRIPTGHPLVLVKGVFTEFEVLLPPQLNLTIIWETPSTATDHRSVGMYQLHLPTT